MGRIPPPPPQPGEFATAYQRRLSKWYAAQAARNRVTLIVIWAVTVAALFIVLVATQ